MTPTEIRPGFHEEWFCEESQGTLAELVSGVADVPGLIVEIGSWEGRSTIAMCNAAAPRVVHAIDTWAGSPGEVSAVLAGRRDVFSQWTANVAHHTTGNVEAHRMGWREFVPTITEPVALVFIDAEHTYVEVADAIASFRPLMAPGGVICGDDAAHLPVRDAVLDAFGDQAMVCWSVWWWQS